MNSILITGFPGFLASSLIPALVERLKPGTRVDCLCERRFESDACRRAEELERLTGYSLRVLPGDIAHPDLGLGSAYGSVQAGCEQVFHFAAIYDLAVPLDLATRVNVDGTRNVLRFAAGCDRLLRFHHVSTCYVSGRYRGVFRENDLQVGQVFGNHYESTKYESEVLVHEAASNGLPTTVYRPSIVTGDSRTGWAPKMDGAYFLIQWLLAQPPVAVVPEFRGSRDSTMNIVPSDYVVRALAHLSSLHGAPMSVYGLADPSPLTVPELADLFGRATGRTVLRIPLTLPVARGLMRTASALHPRLNIPAYAVDYLGHPTQYDCSATVSALEGSGISCPPLADYVDYLVSFVINESGFVR